MFVKITLPAGREANFDRTRARTTFSVTNGLKTIPEQTGNIRVEISYILDGPLYWSLPKTFLGDKVSDDCPTLFMNYFTKLNNNFCLFYDRVYHIMQYSGSK